MTAQNIERRFLAGSSAGDPIHINSTDKDNPDRIHITTNDNPASFLDAVFLELHNSGTTRRTVHVQWNPPGTDATSLARATLTFTVEGQSSLLVSNGLSVGMNLVNSSDARSGITAYAESSTPDDEIKAIGYVNRIEQTGT